jgi:hypothetical protein
MGKLLHHDALWVRFLSLMGLATVVFLVFWAVGYSWLPEGVLRGRSGAAVLAGEEAADTLLAEFLRIALLNLFPIAIVVAANRLLVIQGFPLGYLPPLLWSASYAITLGTNSFSIPLPARMAPSFAVLARSGPYEIAAYVLMAAATYALPTYVAKRLIPPDSEPIEPPPPFWASIDWIGFALALLLLIGASLWEAYKIVSL